MYISTSIALAGLALLSSSASASQPAHNSTFKNPILPGFHPDPSCILVKELDNTFFCASSSFLAFPGIPIHASKDLQTWKLIGNVLNRQEQLPELANTSRQTSGIWAPTIRYHDETFYIVTTLVHDDRAPDDANRWDNIIFSTKNPFDDTTWTNALHFKFEGYDTSPFWHENGQVYITGSHSYKVRPGIDQMTIDLKTGKVGTPINIWNGTGGLAPEGPHVYKKDGYYYLIVAEGGTGLAHMETIARSKSINGPYEGYEHNPILTNANTTEYFQTVGHAELFQDPSGNWWGVALSTRSGPEWITFPMGRETVLYPVTWKTGEWPILGRVQGVENGWHLPMTSGKPIPGNGELITAPDAVDFTPGSDIPPHFVHWRIPHPGTYTVSPRGHPSTLQIKPSKLNLTAYDSQNATTEQTFIGRRQVDTFFTFSVDLDFAPKKQEEEAGVSVFLTQHNHIDLGIALLPLANSSSRLVPRFRFRGLSYTAIPTPITTPLPTSWLNQRIRLEIKAVNLTHYAFAAAPVAHLSQKMIAYGAGSIVSWGFTGTLLGAYATTNGGDDVAATEAYVSRWRYQGQGQYIGN